MSELLYDQAVCREPTGVFRNAMLMAEEESLGFNQTLTENGALTNKSTLNTLVDLFYMTMRNCKKETMEPIMNLAYLESPILLAKMIAYVRDIRGGKGERNVGRDMMVIMGQLNEDIVIKNMYHYISEYGRWDDGIVFFENPNLLDKYLELVGDQLKEDKMKLESGGEKVSISLCSKWVPSEGKSIDKKYKINKKLAKKMGIKQDELRRDYLSPLRRHLNLTETNLMRREYEKINYSQVPSRCMNLHGSKRNYTGRINAFPRNDTERFESYLVSLQNRETKVNASTLYPHEIVQKYDNGTYQSEDILTEAQWSEMEERMRALGKLGKTLMVCDLSGSMSGTPMLISLSLGILVSSCCDVDAFKNMIITFSESPEFHLIEGDTLYKKVNNLKRAAWGMNTNFERVFDKILEKAKRFNIPADEMPERIVVVSDMQFDTASNRRNTNFGVIDEKYRKSGYKRPQLVFWNVKGNIRDTPVLANSKDTALLSGYSPDILKSVLETDILTPFDIMLKALNDSRYDLIKI